MDNNINLVEILKDCPKGMKLYSPICGECTLLDVDKDPKYPITVSAKTNTFFFLPDGRYFDNSDAEYLLFPSKDQHDWSKFQRPFKEGDIVITHHNEHAFIYSGENNDYWECYCGVYCSSRNICINSKQWSNKRYKLRLATEEEKQKLFQAIKDNGYKWNADEKRLEKLIEPKFKVGDRVREKEDQSATFTISDIDDSCYYCGEYVICNVCDQDNYELVPNKFDITTLVPFESKVLVREKETDVWQPAFYGFFNQHNKRFYTTSTTWLMCIPYNEDTKHLIGTTDECDEYYKTWGK